MPPVSADGKSNPQSTRKRGRSQEWPRIHPHKVAGRVYYAMDLGRRGSGKRERKVFKTGSKTWSLLIHENAIIEMLQKNMEHLDPSSQPDPPRKPIGFQVKERKARYTVTA